MVFNEVLLTVASRICNYVFVSCLGNCHSLCPPFHMFISSSGTYKSFVNLQNAVLIPSTCQTQSYFPCTSCTALHHTSTDSYRILCTLTTVRFENLVALAAQRFCIGCFAHRFVSVCVFSPTYLSHRSVLFTLLRSFTLTTVLPYNRFVSDLFFVHHSLIRI